MPTFACHPSQFLRLAALPVLLFGAASTSAQCPIDRIHRVGFDAEGSGLTLAGIAAGLATGDVELRAGGSVLATAVIRGGSFTLEVPVVAASTMLELRARGDGAESFVELASLLGRAVHVADAASRDGIVRVTDMPAMGLRSRLLVEHAMLEQAHPGDPAEDECELAARTAALDPVDVSRRAAIVQIVILDGGIPATAGVATTFDLVRDPAALAAATAAIDAGEPARIGATVNRMAESICQRFVSEAHLVVPSAFSGDQLNLINGELLQVQPGTGLGTLFWGRDAFDWTCTADSVDIDFAGARRMLQYAWRPPIGNVEGERIVERYRIEPIEVMPTHVVVARRSVDRWTFADFPSIADEFHINEGPIAIPRRTESPPAASIPIPGEFVLPTSGVVAFDNAANRVRLDVGGTGMDLDANQPLAWTSTAGGDLQIVFQDRTARLIPFRAESASAIDVLAVTENADDSASAVYSTAVKGGAVAFLDVPERIPGVYLQNAGRVFGDSRFRMELHADRSTVPTTTYVEGPFAGQVDTGAVRYWSRPAPNTIVIRGCSATGGVQPVILDREPASGECSQSYQRREWQVLVTEGDVAHVREHVQSWSNGATMGDPPNSEFHRAILYLREPVQ